MLLFLRTLCVVEIKYNMRAEILVWIPGNSLKKVRQDKIAYSIRKTLTKTMIFRMLIIYFTCLNILAKSHPLNLKRFFFSRRPVKPIWNYCCYLLLYAVKFLLNCLTEPNAYFQTQKDVSKHQLFICNSHKVI